MSARNLSRRQFARAVGAALGAALSVPKLLETPAHASLPAGVPETAIQLNSNENPYGPSPKAWEAITQAKHTLGRYPGGIQLHAREAIAALHEVHRDNIVMGCGSTEILRATDAAFLGPGRNVVVAEPTFEAVLSYAGVAGAAAVKVPLTSEFRHDLPQMAAACDSRTSLVYVCNPNNPTGTIVTREELAAFLARVSESTVVLVDEAYHHFVEDPHYASAMEWAGKRPNLIVARTFSKVYGLAGMRLGYAVAAKDKSETLRRHLLWNNANAAVLPAALASLADPNLVPAQRRLNSETRGWLCGELAKEGRRFIPSQTNFLMVNVGGDVAPVIDLFRSRGILVGRRFPSLSSWLRVSVGTRKEMEAFLAVLRAIVPVAARAA
ncbi:MAG TPA: histidinol-phosphate transaminase [Candidatus Acidoferrales bacterium]|nr:histidinol-phosphate transaminase [Candidatus Acidoferrales bacterium]